MGVHDVRQRIPAYCSVPLTYAKLMPNVCNVHQRMDKISHTSAYVGAIRCGVSTPLVSLVFVLKVGKLHQTSALQDFET